jgi:hypothetical protein
VRSEELHWLAGILEGEGCFTISRKAYKDSVYKYPTIKLNMTDEDVVKKAAKLLGGKPLRLEYGHKPTFSFSIIGKRAEKFMALLNPLMGKRRRARISEILFMRRSYCAKKKKRAIRAFEMRRSGKTFVQIAKSLGVLSHVSAMRIVKKGALL